MIIKKKFLVKTSYKHAVLISEHSRPPVKQPPLVVATNYYMW